MKTTYIMNIIRNSVKGAAVLFGAALVMAGCQRDGLADGLDSGDGQIRYSVSVAGGTKGALINTSGDDNQPLPAGSSFFVSAYKGSGALFENKKATSKDGGVWTNDDPQYWPLSTKLAFFAYANTPASTIEMNAECTAQTLTYAVPADASAHQDILLGYGYGDGGNKGVAEIRFEHPLTAVRFKQGNMTGVTINSITLSGLASGGKVAMTKGAIGEWTVGETEKYETVVTLSGGEDPLEVGETSKLIGEDSEGHYTGAFLLVPQKLAASDGHPVTVTVILTTADGEVTVTADIDSGQWGKGKTNTYTLNYGSDTNFALTVTEWDSETYPVELEEEQSDLLPGKFSVSATHYVQFSKGNLRYTIATSTWSFFDEQYECGSSSYGSGHNNEISLFTWGYDATKSIDPDGAAKDNVNRTSGNLSLSEDWGYVFGGASSDWCTLTIGEWQYLLDGRADAASKVGFATVGGVKGIIILPDVFTDPKKNNGSEAFNPKSTPGYTANVYTTGGNWETMEAKGAVFLPASQMRQGANLPSERNGYGFYWSSSANSSDNAYAISFYGTKLYLDGDYIKYNRGNGNSVRLVQRKEKPDVEPVFVDLGLPSGTLWANVNLGAKSYTGENSIGKSYMWGYVDNTIAGDYTSYLKRWGGAVGFKSKYSAVGTVLAAEDDAAIQISGGNYRMPNIGNWEELRDKCTWTLKTPDPDYGVNGCRITGPNGKEIFLPYTSYDQPDYHLQDACFYWSSSYAGYEYPNYMCSGIYYNASIQHVPHNCGATTMMPIRPVKDGPVHD